MDKPKLLIVDDDQGIRSQLQWGIEGFDIATADSRENAIKQLEVHQPHVVTLDLGLHRTWTAPVKVLPYWMHC